MRSEPSLGKNLEQGKLRKAKKVSGYNCLGDGSTKCSCLRVSVRANGTICMIW